MGDHKYLKKRDKKMVETTRRRALVWWIYNRQKQSQGFSHRLRKFLRGFKPPLRKVRGQTTTEFTGKVIGGNMQKNQNLIRGTVQKSC